MVATISGNVQLPNGTLAHIIAKTDGVPLFIEELTRMVLDRRPEELPETLVDLLTEQLDLLGPARLLAQVGAVIGREFSVELAAAAGDITIETLNDSVARLLASGLVHPTPSRDVLIFKHSLVQDAASRHHPASHPAPAAPVASPTPSSRAFLHWPRQSPRSSPVI
jgi:predicted ATPase